jgi:hypothetical protein
LGDNGEKLERVYRSVGGDGIGGVQLLPEQSSGLGRSSFAARGEINVTTCTSISLEERLIRSCGGQEVFKKHLQTNKSLLELLIPSLRHNSWHSLRLGAGGCIMRGLTCTCEAHM